MNKTFIAIIGLIVLIGWAFLYLYPINKEQRDASYISSKYGLSFHYPRNYFVALEQSFNGERQQHAIVLAEDTDRKSVV